MITRMICVCLLLTMGCSSNQDAKSSADPTPASDQSNSDPAESVKTAIGEAIRLLESKEYVTFLQTYMVPEDLETPLKEQSMAEFAQTFGNSPKAQGLLDAFKSIKDITPTMSADGLKADFPLDETLVGEDHITFVKFDEQWRIPNKPK